MKSPWVLPVIFFENCVAVRQNLKLPISELQTLQMRFKHCPLIKINTNRYMLMEFIEKDDRAAA